MFRIRSCVVGLLALSALAACSDVTSPASSLNSTVARASGGSGGGGGGGGGVVKVVPACSLISLTPKSGYTPQSFSYAAVWINVKLKNCGTTPVSITETLWHGIKGGTLSSGEMSPWTGAPGDSLMYTLDMDFDNYSTLYTSILNVFDANSGALMATCQADSFTPKARGGFGSGGNSGSYDTACYR